MNEYDVTVMVPVVLQVRATNGHEAGRMAVQCALEKHPAPGPRHYPPRVLEVHMTAHTEVEEPPGVA